MTEIAAGPAWSGVALSLIVLAAAAAAALLVVAFRVSGRVDVRRSVLARVPAAVVWEAVRHFPDLHDRHGKAIGLAAVEGWALREGDGAGPGTVWRASGLWGDDAYFADVALVHAEPERRLAIALLRDSFGTERGLRSHRGTLTLEAHGPRTTKINWRLQAGLRGWRLRWARLAGAPRLQARLLDQGLRSLKAHLEKSGRETRDEESVPAVGGSTLSEAAAVAAATLPPQERRPPERAL